MNVIKYHAGSGKGNRAMFVCGKASVPAAMISRVLKAVEGKSDAALTRLFISKLAPRHGEFLEAIEKAEIGYREVIRQMGELAPARTKGTPRIKKEASAVANMLCRKYSNKTPDEMFSAFLATASLPEFRALVIALAGENEKKFGRNAQGRIRVRPERKDLVAIAAKARAGRRKK